MILDAPIRLGLIADAEITSYLGLHDGAPCVFTRRPVPSEAPYNMIIIGPNISVTNEDSLNGRRPVVVRDVIAYGWQTVQDGPIGAGYRRIEELGYLLQRFFHRRKPITVTGYHVIDIVASGPIPAPTDDEKLVGRAVTLTVRLQERS